MRRSNIKLKNRHTAIIADSGAGKSVALMAIINNFRGQCDRILLWDTNEDHTKIAKKSFKTVRKFSNALADEVEKQEINGESKACILSYTGHEDYKEFEQWCMAVCKSLNGNYNTLVIIEELAGVSETVARAGEWFKRLINQGRKYGAVVMFTTQRPQEVPKTAYSQCSTHFIGMIKDGRTREYLQKSIGLSYLSGPISELTVGKFVVSSSEAVYLMDFFAKKGGVRSEINDKKEQKKLK